MGVEVGVNYRCSHHRTQLLVLDICELLGVVVVKHRLPLSWPLLHEKGVCLLIWKGKHYLEGQRNNREISKWCKYERVEQKTFGPVLKSYFKLKEGILGSHSRYNLSSHMKPAFLDSSHLKQY